MSEESAKIQSRLIRDLEPVVAVELERHLSVQKNWYPHEYVPWSCLLYTSDAADE